MLLTKYFISVSLGLFASIVLDSLLWLVVKDRRGETQIMLGVHISQMRSSLIFKLIVRSKISYQFLIKKGKKNLIPIGDLKDGAHKNVF